MWFHAALVALLAAHGADVATTIAAIQNRPGDVREWNVLLAPLVHHPAAFGAVVIGSAAATNLALVKLHARHPRLAGWIAAGGAMGVTGAAIQNARRGRR